MSHESTSEIIEDMKKLIEDIKEMKRIEISLIQDYKNNYYSITEEKVLRAIYNLNQYLDNIYKRLEEKENILMQISEKIYKAIRLEEMSKEIIE